MSDKGNLEFIAALTSRLKAQQDAMASLSSGIESALADVVKALDDKGANKALAGIERALSAIEQGMADVIGGISSSATIDMGPLVDAIKALSPVVNVTVQPAPAAPPAPITVEAILPPQPPAQVHMMPAPNTGKWKVTYPTQHGNKTMTIERLE
jgi:hypothetical protein